jgi:hypothetical protein
MDEDDDVYAVERILSERRGKRGESEYLCRWEGWGAEADSWEPARHILDEQLIADFERERGEHMDAAGRESPM